MGYSGGGPRRTRSQSTELLSYPPPRRHPLVEDLQPMRLACDLLLVFPANTAAVVYVPLPKLALLLLRYDARSILYLRQRAKHLHMVEHGFVLGL